MNIENFFHDKSAWRPHRQRATGGNRPLRSVPDYNSMAWPVGTVTEIHCSQQDGQAMGLVVPALAQLSLEDRWIAWVAPPFVPYAPALRAAGVDLSRVLVIHAKEGADSIWAVERALRTGTCGAVLGWLTGTKGVAPKATVQRLRQAAEQGNSRGILFRSSAALQSVSATMVPLVVEGGEDLRPVTQQLEIGLN